MFIFDMIRADKHNARADKINIEAFNNLSNSERELNDIKTKTLQSMEKLANRKRGILLTSINEFICVYDKIMKINFTQSDGIKQLNDVNYNELSIKQMKTMVVTSGYSMDSYQTISTFLVGTLTGGLIGGFSNIIAKEAELNVVTAKIRSRQAEVASSQAETLKVAVDSIYQRSERLAKLLAQMNLLFSKSIKNTSEMVLKNGSNRLNYSYQDKQAIMNCFNLADAIKKILDTPLIDEEGELTQKSIEAISIGEKFIAEQAKLVNSI